MELAAAVIGLIGTVAGLVVQYFKNKKNSEAMEAKLVSCQLELNAAKTALANSLAASAERGSYVDALHAAMRAHFATCTVPLAELANQLLGKIDEKK